MCGGVAAGNPELVLEENLEAFQRSCSPQMATPIRPEGRGGVSGSWPLPLFNLATTPHSFCNQAYGGRLAEALCLGECSCPRRALHFIGSSEDSEPLKSPMSSGRGAV